MLAPLPSDILWAISEHVQDDKRALATLCRVSRRFREVSETLLYRCIKLSFPHVTPVCIALATQPHLALHVRHFETRKSPGWKPRDATHLLHMRDALRRMLRLRILRIHFSGPLAWILEGCYFSELHSMLCNLSCDHHLASFFKRHTRLIDITLSSVHHDHFPCYIDHACLPSLKRISADPVWLEILVPNHSITDIDIWDFRERLVTTVGSFSQMDWLASSLASVMTLSVSEDLLVSRGAANIASLVPYLNHLKIKCTTSDLYLSEEAEARIVFTAWLSNNLGYFRSLHTVETILCGNRSLRDIDESLMQHFVVDASEGSLDLREFVVNHCLHEAGVVTKFIWHRPHGNWTMATLDQSYLEY